MTGLLRRRTVLLAFGAVLLVGACTTDPGNAGTSASPTDSTSAATSTASAAPTTPVASGTAIRLLATIAVKGRAPKTGYDRDEYGPAWTDDNTSPLGHNGCDTRNDILRRDLRAVALKAGSNGCAVSSGTLADAYTSRTIAFVRGPRSADVQIDHVVALSNAWQTGAFRWTAATRTAFANDPINLLAVDGSTNESKGDGDAATWLPPSKPYRCSYVARQVAVKARYGLWMTPAERTATQRILQTCPGRPAPTESPAARVTLAPRAPASSRPASSGSASSRPASSRPASAGCTTTSSGNCIRGGQLCPHDSDGRTGRDGAGTTYVCRGDRDRPHWERP